MIEQANTPEIVWDHGTAYDLFASIYAIHSPGEFGLRASWAAGVRGRLSAKTREFFGDVMLHLQMPIPWLYSLPQPKNAAAILDRLEGMKPEEIPPTMLLNPFHSGSCDEVERKVLSAGRWDESDVVKLRECCPEEACFEHVAISPESIRHWLDLWTRPAEFGNALRTGLTEFYDGFFRDEERRISADMERALERGKELTGRLSAAELFDELSHGIRIESYVSQRTLILVPCYWCSPRIIHADLQEGMQIVLFGARPPEASLVPGDTVPAQLLLSLQALSDPTRLAIIRGLVDKPMTQTEIAKKLRLRPPTISHHLRSLRIAELITYLETGKDELRYGARIPRIDQICSAMKAFFKIEEK